MNTFIDWMEFKNKQGKNGSPLNHIACLVVTCKLGWVIGLRQCSFSTTLVDLLIMY